MRNLVLRIFLAIVLASVIQQFFTPTVRADSEAGIRAEVTIRPMGTVTVGEHLTITAHLMTVGGDPIDNEPLVLYVDGTRERRTRTDSTGTASFRIQRDLSAGTYTIHVEYGGSATLLPSTASRQFVMRPFELEIYTVPPLPGARFSLDHELFIADVEGIARVEVAHVGSYQLEALPFEDSSNNLRAEFSRWNDEMFIPTREVKIPQQTSFEAGYILSYRASLRFNDQDGNQVNPMRISSVSIKSSFGGTFELEEETPHWYQDNRVVRRRFGLEVTRLLYSVLSVNVDGANVVNRAQQRFFVNPNDVWRIEILLYSTSFTAQDALFRFRIGSGINLVHPDGRREYVAFGSEDEITVHSLARGLYSVSVAGAAGYAPDIPVALSRDQDVNLLVISYLDIMVATLLGLIIILGLLFFGRPHLIVNLRLRLSRS